MLSREKDIESLIRMSRIVHLLFKVVFTKSQMASVRYFHKYVIKDSHREMKTEIGEFSDEALWENLDLDNDKIDRLILYEVARR